MSGYVFVNCVCECVCSMCVIPVVVEGIHGVCVSCVCECECECVCTIYSGGCV